MKNVLIVNQSAELYGADKALLELIENYPEGYTPIVVLHQDGPLKLRLENLGVKVIRSSVVKVKRGILKPGFFLRLPFDVVRSIRHINKELAGTRIDLVHSNAISVFIGAFYTFFLRKKHLWHVHEIIEHPKALAHFYPKVVSFFSDRIIFNSEASFRQFRIVKKNISKKSAIVHNGQKRDVAVTDAGQIASIRKNTFCISSENAVVIGLIGRISRLKGQILLLKSFRKLLGKHPNIHLVYVGSPPDGQEHFLEALTEKIHTLGLHEKVTVVDFQEHIWPIYDALDIVVVPSTEPESFGLVATEAMLSQKPVVGSRLGGLAEIIEDGKTGFLFEPKNADDLADKLDRLVSDPELAAVFGRNGKTRVAENFSCEKYVGGVRREYDALTR